ncbi:M16 family metallopeptidase [Leptospira idonii]|uniref:Insulinase family protein n=1 Tax=Leptospira idonii TaxID=1193500 RepID=A0A4R9M0D1_9LEPT|nr:pitrilysin family protein [Leptospira idonii]TGN20113.1 insulinase family protein [Leptospira idonii]
MKKIYLILVMCFVSSVLFAREMGDFVKNIKLSPLVVHFPEIQKEVLENGTEIQFLSNPEFPIVYADFHIYHGRKNLGKRPVEIVRLLEDSWEFSGSKTYPKDSFLQEFEKLGAGFSLAIDYDKTSIHLSYLKKDEERIFSLLKSFWEEPNLNSEVISTMRGRITDEIKRRNDNPTQLGGRKAKEALYKNTIYGSTSQISSLEQIREEDLLSLQKEILSEKKKILLLTGDANLQTWKSYLSRWKNYESSGQKTSEEITSELLAENIKNSKQKNILVEKEVAQSFVYMTGVIPKHNDPDFYAIQVLNYIIGGGGFNSYYMREIRNNRGLAYSAGSSADFQADYGTINFFAMTKTESVPEVLSLMKELIEPKLIDSLKEEELTRAKVAINNQFVFLFEDSRKTLTNELRFRDHKMPKDYLLKFRENIDKVSLEDLRRVGKKYFSSSDMLVVIVGPKSLQSQLGGSFRLVQPEEILP